MGGVWVDDLTSIIQCFISLLSLLVPNATFVSIVFIFYVSTYMLLNQIDILNTPYSSFTHNCHSFFLKKKKVKHKKKLHGLFFMDGVQLPQG